MEWMDIWKLGPDILLNELSAQLSFRSAFNGYIYAIQVRIEKRLMRNSYLGTLLDYKVTGLTAGALKVHIFNP